MKKWFTDSCCSKHTFKFSSKWIKCQFVYLNELKLNKLFKNSIPRSHSPQSGGWQRPDWLVQVWDIDWERNCQIIGITHARSNHIINFTKVSGGIHYQWHLWCLLSIFASTRYCQTSSLLPIWWAWDALVLLTCISLIFPVQHLSSPNSLLTDCAHYSVGLSFS